MYKLMIVDDEEFVREAMAHLINWSDYGIELIDTAGNGITCLQKIEENTPDIIMTDIKMPVMNGIELIHSVKRKYPDIEFIVLSGYGEFEYTSKAMEEGIKHYILKPCDESMIIPVLDKVKTQINEKRIKRQEENKVQSTLNNLIPRAKEQVFRNVLLGLEGIEENDKLIVNAPYENVVIVSFRLEKGFDCIEQFVIENVLKELLGEKNVYVATSIEKDLIYLINMSKKDIIAEAVDIMKEKTNKFGNERMQVAISKSGTIVNIREMYYQILELYKVHQVEQNKEILQYDFLDEKYEATTGICDFAKILNSNDFSEIVFELYLAFLKMNIKRYDIEKIRDTAISMIKVLYGKEYVADGETANEIFLGIVDFVTNMQKVSLDNGKEEIRVKEILLNIYQNISNQDLTINYLAKEVMFMNEDYLSRVFAKNRKVKFSAYMLETRINLAKRLMQWDEELKISQIAEIIGYAPDGQYFSKAFRKVVNLTPTEYKESLKNQ